MKRWMLLFLLLAPSAHAQDMLDLRTAVIHDSPADVADWPLTTQIQTIQMRPTGDNPDGLAVTFVPDTWPNYTPPGWTGPIEYTVWAFTRVQGVWHGAGFIQMWRGRPSTGAPILSDFHANWAYACDRWGSELCNYLPQPGDMMGFMVTAGNARDTREVTSVRERSNVVTLVLPAGDRGVVNFTPLPAPVPSPVPAPVPVPPVPAPVPQTDPALVQRVDALELMLNSVVGNFESRLEAVEKTLNTVNQQMEVLGARTIPVECRASAFGIPLACRLQ